MIKGEKLERSGQGFELSEDLCTSGNGDSSKGEISHQLQPEESPPSSSQEVEPKKKNPGGGQMGYGQV